jgi:hypothetical protein
VWINVILCFNIFYITPLIIIEYILLHCTFQLRNAVYDLEYPMLQEMHNLLEKLKSCKGTRECTIRFRNDMAEQGDWILFIYTCIYIYFV